MESATAFVDTGAVRFEVETAGDPDSDRLALLLHGFPESAFSWRYQMPLLARMGYLAWAPNQRGYGHTTRFPRIDDYRIEILVDDVARLIDASGKQRITLIGHDWGGAVAWMSALMRIRPIDRLVVMNLPHPTCFQRRGRPWAPLRGSWYVFLFQIPWLPEKLVGARGARAVRDAFRRSSLAPERFPDEVLDVYAAQALQPGALTAMLNWYRAMRRLDPALERLIAAPPLLEVPTLMIWGEHDVALGKELTYGTDELVRDLTLHYLPGVSHWVQQEAPEKVNELLEAWLARDDAAPGNGSTAA